jgi:hypothetical protein
MTKATLASLFLCLCLASPVSAGPPQLVFVGDSWACGDAEFELIHRRAVSVVCEPGSTTLDWLASRREWIPELPPNSTVVFSVGGMDSALWIAEGREDRSKWAPSRVLRRTRLLAKLLRREGHTVRFTAYWSPLQVSYLDMLPQHMVFRFSPTYGYRFEPYESLTQGGIVVELEINNEADLLRYIDKNGVLPPLGFYHAARGGWVTFNFFRGEL